MQIMILNEIMQARKERDKSFSVFARNPCGENWKVYKSLRKKTGAIVRRFCFYFGNNYCRDVNGS